MNIRNCFLIMVLFSFGSLAAQQEVKFVRKDKEKKVDIFVGGKYFTSYMYPDSIDKPVLHPLTTSTGTLVTREFPLHAKVNERTDHPHHVGLWFNYGDVNGLDFWNNSYAIKPADKPKYGSIRHQQIVTAKDGKVGKLEVTSDWVDHTGKVLLKEKTTFLISGSNGTRTIERTAVLTAQDDKVDFKDNKEGMLGLRVCRELEIPSDKPEIYTDAQGKPTAVPAINNEGVTGNYLTSEGKTGNAAWGTRGKWCLLYGQKENSPVSIAIIDKPSNPGYPTYWHARGYGLFAANTLGQEALSGGKDKLNYSLAPHTSTTFSYKIVISDGKVPTTGELDKMAEGFAK